MNKSLVMVGLTAAFVSLTGMKCINEPTSATTFMSMAQSCISPQLLGPSGQLVFLGPVDYRPGDLFTRAMNASSEYMYTAQFEYAKQVGVDVAKNVVRVSTMPVLCKLSADSSFSFDATAAGTFSTAAIPANASAGIAFKNGTVAVVSARNILVDDIPFAQPFATSMQALPPLHPARKAIEAGGYFVTNAVLVVEDYSLEVKYGPEFDANAAANASITGTDKTLKAGVTVKAKDSSTLIYTIPGKTVVAVVVRPVSTDFSILSAAAPADGSTKPLAGLPISRDSYKQQ